MKMKLETSSKTGSGGRRPHIRKGYYPGQLKSIEEYKDKDGNWKEGKWGRMLILTFALFKADDKGKPVAPIEYMPDVKTPAITKGVEISAFLYHQNKDDKADGGFRTAITPNSKITSVLKCLGWVFSDKGVDTDALIGNWCELNIDDYEAKDGEETYKASTIAGFNEYEGPEIKKGDVKAMPEKENDSPSKDSTPTKNTTQPDKEKVPEKASSSSSLKDRIDDDVEVITPKPTVADLEKKKEVLKQLKDEGSVSDEAYYQSVEQLDTQIKAIQDGK